MKKDKSTYKVNPSTIMLSLMIMLIGAFIVYKGYVEPGLGGAGLLGIGIHVCIIGIIVLINHLIKNTRVKIVLGIIGLLLYIYFLM